MLEDKGIERTDTPFGLRLEVSLTSYWAIPIVLIGCLFTYVGLHSSSAEGTANGVMGGLFAAIGPLVFGSLAVVRVFGVSIITLEHRVLTVETGVGPLKYKQSLTLDGTESIDEVDVKSSEGRERFVAIRHPHGADIRFGRLMSHAQRVYVVSALRTHNRGTR